MWLWVMCLTGVDYFSTLGYQPSIAFENTGLLAPFATVVLVTMTLFGALPVYRYVCGQSPHGQGSIAMLEKLVKGWTGKIFVLVLLGFAATDFVITKTLSAADAAVHLLDNPYWKQMPAFITDLTTDRQRLGLTLLLLTMLGATFLRGFNEVIGIAVAIVSVYLVLNLIVVGTCLVYLVEHPDLWHRWYAEVLRGDAHWHLHHAPVHGAGWGVIILACLLLFPKLALGLSGFETGVAVMPLVRGDARDTHANPAGRVRNTRKLLLTAALIMSVMLLGSSLVTCTLIPDWSVLDRGGDPTAVLEKGGKAYERTLAYLAHGEGHHPISPLFGNIFGTLYDAATIIILWFAGASAMAGLLNLVPQYLPRYGMAPEWATALRPLVVLFTIINLVVTWIFNASVSAQADAYATGVLVLMSSACVATVIGKYRSRTGNTFLRIPWMFVAITGVFLYTTGTIVWEKPVGLKIASGFILAIVISSLVSRAMRSTELRFRGFRYADEQSRLLWDSMKMIEFPVLVPHRPGRRDLASKETDIRKEHRLTPEVFIVFLEVDLGDVSDFYQEPVIEIRQEEGRFILKVSGAASIAHVIAAVGLELSKAGSPPEIHFGWSDESPVAANIGFLLFGEGNVPWLVRELVRRAETDSTRQPRIIIG